MMIGKMVLYKMRANDCGMRTSPNGERSGNQNYPGDLVPALITRVWPNEMENGTVDGYNITVFPDGPTSFWATSVKFGDAERDICPVDAPV